MPTDPNERREKQRQPERRQTPVTFMTTPLLLGVLKSAAYTTTTGQHVRRLIWSMWSNHIVSATWAGVPAVNLFDMLADLPADIRAEVAALFLMDLEPRNELLKTLLHESGEWELIDLKTAFN
jgi:hypothetical protein